MFFISLMPNCKLLISLFNLHCLHSFITLHANSIILCQNNLFKNFHNWSLFIKVPNLNVKIFNGSHLVFKPWHHQLLEEQNVFLSMVLCHRPTVNSFKFCCITQDRKCNVHQQSRVSFKYHLGKCQCVFVDFFFLYTPPSISIFALWKDSPFTIFCALQTKSL
jgi:hypothetical protein